MVELIVQLEADPDPIELPFVTQEQCERDREAIFKALSLSSPEGRIICFDSFCLEAES